MSPIEADKILYRQAIDSLKMLPRDIRFLTQTVRSKSRSQDVIEFCDRIDEQLSAHLELHCDLLNALHSILWPEIKYSRRKSDSNFWE